MKKYKAIIVLLLSGVIFSIAFIYSDFLLNSVSLPLVYEDKLSKSEAIVVLSGSGTGNRIKTAAKLFHKGYGKKIFFSGFKIYRETNTSSLMKKYALELGVPENKIVAEISEGESSTRGESIANIKLLKKHGIKSFILVTSTHHTRRSKLTYQHTMSLKGEQLEFLVVPAPDPLAPINGWWKLRTGKITIFMEYIKLVSYFFDFVFWN